MLVHLEVEQRWVDVDERNARERPDERHKLVQVVGSEPRNEHRHQNDQAAEIVLVPFHPRVVFPRSVLVEQLVLEDLYGGEQL